MHANHKFSWPLSTAVSRERVTTIGKTVKNLYWLTNFYRIIVSTGISLGLQKVGKFSVNFGNFPEILETYWDFGKFLEISGSFPPLCNPIYHPPLFDCILKCYLFLGCKAEFSAAITLVFRVTWSLIFNLMLIIIDASAAFLCF